MIRQWTLLADARGARHRGIALLLVLLTVALATLIGMAMLSSASLQSQIASSSGKSAVADYLADSAVQTAEYYLQRNLANMPPTWGTSPGYTIKASAVTVANVDGSFDLNVVPTSVPNQYAITAVGRSGGTSPLTRTTTATVNVLLATPTYAAGIGGSATVSPNNYFKNGPVAFSGTISPAPGATYYPGGTRTFSSTDFAVPASAGGNINYYGGDTVGGTYTTSGGVVGSPQNVVSSGAYTLSSPSALNTLLAASNPGNVFYFPGDLTITGGGTYNATLIVRGRLIFSTPSGSSVTINRQPGFPAVVADGQLYITSGTKNLALNMNGVTWLGGGTTWGGTGTMVTGSQVKINGAMLMPASKVMGNPGTSATFTVNYTPANVDVLNLTTAAQPAIGLKLISWSQ